MDYINEKYRDFTAHEISILDNLRVLRNRIAYEGFSIEPAYLGRNEIFFQAIIGKLRNLLEKKLA